MASFWSNAKCKLIYPLVPLSYVYLFNNLQATIVYAAPKGLLRLRCDSNNYHKRLTMF